MPLTKLPWKTYYFYRQHLDERERMIHKALFEGIRDFQPVIPLPVSCTVQEVRKVYDTLRKDYPMFYHVSSRFQYEYIGETCISMMPVYLMDEQTYNELYRKIHAFLNDSCRTLQGLTTYQKVRSIHNSIARHVIYHGVEEENSHNILGAILYRKAVCESISKTFKLICDVNRIPCIVVYGKAGKKPWTEDMGHAWNMVRIDREWFLVDVTWDLKAEFDGDDWGVQYRYLCRSEEYFRDNHELEDPILPRCCRDADYYKLSGLYVHGPKDLQILVEAHLAKGIRSFHLEYSPEVGMTLQEMYDTLAVYLAPQHRSVKLLELEAARLLLIKIE